MEQAANRVAPKPPIAGRFVKGQSGNPSGRPKRQPTLEDMAKAHTPAAISALVLALKNPRERVPAAIALLDRGWGKPAQMISGDSNRPLIVDFRWADNTEVSTHSQPVIDAVTEQLSVAWSDDEKQNES